MGFIKPLFSLKFWFSLTPPALLPMFYWFFLIFFLGLLIASVVAGRIYKKEKDNFVLRLSAKYLKGWFLTGSIMGFILLLFNYERATLLSARFWFLVWLIVFGVWLFFIIKKIMRLPEREEMARKHARFDKYLPKRKK